MRSESRQLHPPARRGSRREPGSLSPCQPWIASLGRRHSDGEGRPYLDGGEARTRGETPARLARFAHSQQGSAGSLGRCRVTDARASTWTVPLRPQMPSALSADIRAEPLPRLVIASIAIHAFGLVARASAPRGQHLHTWCSVGTVHHLNEFGRWHQRDSLWWADIAPREGPPAFRSAMTGPVGPSGDPSVDSQHVSRGTRGLRPRRSLRPSRGC